MENKNARTTFTVGGSVAGSPYVTEVPGSSPVTEVPGSPRVTEVPGSPRVMDPATTGSAAMGGAADRAIVLGGRARCEDGESGEITRIVLDPIARRVTHVVVSDMGAEVAGWMVPVGLLGVSGGGVRLACTKDRLHDMEAVRPAKVTPAETGGMSTMIYQDETTAAAAVRPGDQVRSSDGVVGEAIGILVAPEDPFQMTHLLVRIGGGTGTVAVPSQWISSLATGFQLNLPTAKVMELPTASWA